MRQHRRLIVLTLVCNFLLSACVAPARTYKPYVADAVTTAEQMNSAVQTALVAAGSAADNHAYSNYLSAVFGDTEDTAAAIQSSFDSEQPPSPRADQLRNRLDAVLQDAASVLVALRIHTRRGEIKRLKMIAQPLNEVSNKLNAFIKARR